MHSEEAKEMILNAIKSEEKNIMEYQREIASHHEAYGMMCELRDVINDYCSYINKEIEKYFVDVKSHDVDIKQIDNIEDFAHTLSQLFAELAALARKTGHDVA